MTTNVFDSNACVMATDSRWSVEYGDYLFYLDDTNYDKIEYSHGKALMFAGFGNKIQIWKNWIRTNPTDDSNMPDVKGMSVCMVDAASKTVDFDAEQDIIAEGVYYAGSGSRPACGCWQKNKCAITAVETAKVKDFFSGGDVKFIDFKKDKNNIANQHPTAQLTISMVNQAISKRGLVMKMNVPGSASLPFTKAANDSVITEEQIRGKIAAGELSANAPCDGMHNDWTDENKEKFRKALGKMFGWKN